MFNPLRLFRRQEEIDDSATAYIEGRATAADAAMVRERASREPGLAEELDSIRDTVSLLRSIEPVRAPRSFALSYAPARVRPSRGHRLSLAPAALAVMAVVGVGLLAAGNLADVVQQSGTGADNSMERSTMLESNESTPGVASITGPANDSKTEPSGEPEQGPPITGLMPVPQATSEPVAPDAGRSSAEGAAETDTGEFGSQSLTALEDRMVAAADDDAVFLPVWQLQVVLGALAVMMAALWLYLRRRAAAAQGL